MKSRFGLNATMVANEFIDQYMSAANGEYVKVYLYVLRHQEESVTVIEVADALNHTEADVRRALAYWTRLGVLLQTDKQDMEEKITEEQRAEPSDAAGLWSEAARREEAASGERVHYTAEQVGQLTKKSEFEQLLYISQKYMNKVFTPKDCEVFAYLYDGLRMPVELLEYLVEYCVQGEHYSIRYLETVALNWHELGINTVERARQHTASFSNETFAVMKAFGINDRRPGDSELTIIRKWFKEWGFSKEMVLEACARTLRATQKPSFSYADKILAEWRKGQVRTLTDVKKQDAKRESRKPAASQQTVSRPPKNQFHNFEQRNTNYDAMVLERLKQRLGEQ